MSLTPKDQFRNVILMLQEKLTEGSIDHVNGLLKEAIHAFGSNTPENLNCAHHIAVGQIKRIHGPDAMGLTTGISQIPLADIVNELEEMPLPSSLGKSLPTLSQAEWEACLRMVTLILVALEVR